MVCSSRITTPQAFFLLVTLLISAGFSAAFAQTQKARATHGGDDDAPLFQEYRAVRIGMTTDEVRKKLSNLSDKSDEQDFFVFSENENAQVFYDKTKKVFAISVNFLNGASEIPTPKAVFGSDLPAKPDGSCYKLVRYPKAGYWVSFSRTAGDSPLTTVTLQKIE
ncbi:MAG TPA: hypothetical protein VJM12_08145 [Pyrinomonadaceae bacterium]|nr:hypothetical protein [Pyrinomonadaceae bacterium]